MTTPQVFHLVASVLYPWTGNTEHWEFELPVEATTGRMRSACDGNWRPWHAMDIEQTQMLMSLCQATLAQPGPGLERPSLAIDGSAMKLRLRGPGDSAEVEDTIALDSGIRHGEVQQTSPLLRLVAAIYRGKWPDRAPMVAARIEMQAVTAPPPDPLFATTRPPAWPGRSSTGSVILPLPQARKGLSPKPRVLDWLPVVPKHELHLTLLSAGEANELVAHLPEEAWRETFEALHWTLTPSGKAVLLHENKPAGLEYSVVTPVDCPALNTFRQQLSEASGAFLSPTVPHVTLWTRPMGRGIGISSTEQYRNFFVRELEAEAAAGFLEGTIFARIPETETH